jgi:hypothetical protein
MTTNPAVTVTAADHAAADAYAAAADRAAAYGAGSEGMLTATTVAMRNAIDYSQRPTWLGNRDLVKVHVIRLLGFGDGTPWIDLSYCYGVLKDGTPVRVDLGRSQFTKGAWKSQIVQCFKDAGRYGKAMGLDFDDPAMVSKC